MIYHSTSSKRLKQTVSPRVLLSEVVQFLLKSFILKPLLCALLGSFLNHLSKYSHAIMVVKNLSLNKLITVWLALEQQVLTLIFQMVLDAKTSKLYILLYAFVWTLVNLTVFRTVPFNMVKQPLVIKGGFIIIKSRAFVLEPDLLYEANKGLFNRSEVCFLPTHWAL